jgi:hypothetical protein
LTFAALVRKVAVCHANAYLYCLIAVLARYDFPAFGRIMAVYVVPTAAGHCRMITRFIKNKKTFARRPGLMGIFLKVRRGCIA